MSPSLGTRTERRGRIEQDRVRRESFVNDSWVVHGLYTSGHPETVTTSGAITKVLEDLITLSVCEFVLLLLLYLRFLDC